MRLPLALALCAALVSGPAQAADRGSGGERLRELDTELLGLSKQVERIRRNFAERRNLVGIGEALRRYQDAVYAYLVEDYASAALDFEILVQSGAFRRSAPQADLPVAADCDWYLAESLFQLDMYRLAADQYRAIYLVGPKHPFFADAVRRLLEVYGILGDDAQFNEVYASWIASGKVRSTDLVAYTLAKTYHRRGDGARAKEAFEAFGPSSPYYSRARYFLGVMMIAEKNLPQAIKDMEIVAAAEAKDDDARRVRELGWLALGRLHYERGDFAQAREWYEKIDHTFPTFADRLRELIWTLVKQGEYEKAVGEVDQFLAAFPQHRYTADLEILRGHLQMKVEAYDAARASYERVVDSYTPIATRLDEVSRTPVEAQRFLQRMGDTGGTSGLPPFAVERLRARDDVDRATQAYLSVRADEKTLADAETTARELEAALAGNSDALRNFVDARLELSSARGALLAMAGRLLEVEGAHLRPRVGAAGKAEIAAIAEARLQVDVSVAEVQGATRADNDRVQIYEEQVREVQQVAFRVGQLAQEQVAAANSALDLLGARGGGSAAAVDGWCQEPLASLRALTPGSDPFPRGVAGDGGCRSEILAQREELRLVANALEGLQGEVTHKRIMRGVEAKEVGPSSADRGAALQRYQGLRQRMAALRRQAPDGDSAQVFAEIDRLWGLLDAADRVGGEAARVLGSSEARELALVRQKLAGARQDVAVLRRDVATDGQETERVATAIVLGGLRDLRGEFENDVLLADKGLVDVYWVRKTNTTDAMDMLTSEQARLLQELDERFRVIKENLGQ
jgi:TolA-binding protein